MSDTVLHWTMHRLNCSSFPTLQCIVCSGLILVQLYSNEMSRVFYEFNDIAALMNKLLKHS